MAIVVILIVVWQAIVYSFMFKPVYERSRENQLENINWRVRTRAWQ